MIVQIILAVLLLVLLWFLLTDADAPAEEDSPAQAMASPPASTETPNVPPQLAVQAPLPDAVAVPEGGVPQADPREPVSRD